MYVDNLDIIVSGFFLLRNRHSFLLPDDVYKNFQLITKQFMLINVRRLKSLTDEMSDEKIT